MEESLIMESVLAHSVSSIIISLIFAYFCAYRNNNLDLPGASMVFIQMTIHFIVGLRYGMMLLVYLFVLFWMKRHSASRSWQKVFPHPLVPVIWVLSLLKYRGWEDKCLDSAEGSNQITTITGVIVGHYVFLVGDYWSSEIIDDENPCPTPNSQSDDRDDWRRECATVMDWAARAAKGGLFIGITFVLFGHLMVKCSSDLVRWKQWLIPPLTAWIGLHVRLIHSFLAETLPFRGFCNVRHVVVRSPGPNVTRLHGYDFFNEKTVYIVSTLLSGHITSKALAYIY